MEQLRAWFFQANPTHYDVEAALDARDRIWWRVPQHTGDIHAGDTVALWRSGPDAGVVGVGRVLTEPRSRPDDPEDAPFIRDGSSAAAADVTRALVGVRRVPFVPKQRVQELAGLGKHQVIVAPMGTVFPMTPEQWMALRELVPDPPDPAPGEHVVLPDALGWQQRAKGVLPMPGGYGGYLDSLRTICSFVIDERPTSAELTGHMEAGLGLRPAAAGQRESFLRKVDLIRAVSGICQVGPWTEKWLRGGDDRLVVALLHRRCQFIGELLVATREPMTHQELLTVANDRYGMGWDTQTQITNRRGWLQSAGMLADIGDGRVQATPAGTALLDELALHDPSASPVVPIAEKTPGLALARPADVTDAGTATVEALAESITAAATDSAHPDRFEHVVRDAFTFLGFQAEWLGGSGKTDVLLDARLGREESYRVAVDCKTSGSGSVSDQQTDWVTLVDHKAKHDADHIALVGPNPIGSRLLQRAAQHGVALISAEQLAGLCRQHAKTPLGLDDFRSLFDRGGSLDTRPIDERADEVRRLILLAAALYEAIRDRSTVFGLMTARDLFLVLAGRTVAEGATEDELQVLLDSMAGPLLGILHGSRAGGYRVTTSAAVARRRIEAVAVQISGAGSNGPEASIE